MRYYSDITKKLYENEEALQEAEAAQLKEEEAAKEAALQKSTRKKELAGMIEAADEAVDLAYQMLEEARAHCKEIQEKANKEKSEILESASEAVKEAEKVRMEAIRTFNEEFGPFRVSYTGEKAQKELDRATKQFDNLFADLFGFRF